MKKCKCKVIQLRDAALVCWVLLVHINEQRVIDKADNNSLPLVSLVKRHEPSRDNLSSAEKHLKAKLGDASASGRRSRALQCACQQRKKKRETSSSDYLISRNSCVSHFFYCDREC